MQIRKQIIRQRIRQIAAIKLQSEELYSTISAYQPKTNDRKLNVPSNISNSKGTNPSCAPTSLPPPASTSPSDHSDGNPHTIHAAGWYQRCGRVLRLAHARRARGMSGRYCFSSGSRPSLFPRVEAPFCQLRCSDGLFRQLHVATEAAS